MQNNNTSTTTSYLYKNKEKIGPEKFICVGVYKKNSDSTMNTLDRLVESAGGQVIANMVQKLEHPNSRTYIGSGKVQELLENIKLLEVDGVVFDDELSPSQLQNLSEILKIKVIDRTSLILDIFAQRATTKEAQAYVELAQLEYRLPRLRGEGILMSRTGAGIGTRGPGEQKLETDKRAILREIKNKKRILEKAKINREATRKRRRNSEIPFVVFAGTTNVGKSTIMNNIISLFGNKEKIVYADNRFFATLDPNIRQIKTDTGKIFLIGDTVGFIESLPPKLNRVFESTIEEVLEADLIVHVLDSTEPNLDIKLMATNKIFKDKGVSNKILYVMNKIDSTKDYNLVTPIEDTICISALNTQDIKKLVSRIESLI